MAITTTQQEEIIKMKEDLIKQHMTLQERTLKVAGAIEVMQIVEKKLGVVDQEKEEEVEEDNNDDDDDNDDVSDTPTDNSSSSYN